MTNSSGSINAAERKSARRPLCSPAELARLASLELRARTIVEGHLAGLHRSPRQGFSVEFAEHREYTPGDDLRHLDWKVYGKRDRLYLKQYDEETNFACQLVVDVSESMAYRSEVAALSKWDYAATLAAALAWLVLKQQDAVGITLFDQTSRSTLAPSGQALQLKSILQLLEAALPANPSRLGAVLDQLAERSHRRGVFVIVTDLFDDPQEVRQGLRHLRYRGHDVSLLQVIDPAEQEFPFESATEFEGLEGTGSETVNPRSIRADYLREFNAFLRDAASACRELGVDYRLFRTDEPPEQGLFEFLGRRRSRRT
ncbi:MAG: DUF58 domain-containing protein [Planctomycetaceae bacterium]